MKCKNCGAEIPEGMLFCGVCGTHVQEEEGVEKVQAEVVKDKVPGMDGGHRTQSTPAQVDSTPYIIFAILATLFCFMPTGIPAIVYAAKVDSANLRGDREAAAEAAKKSKMWSIISAVVAAAAVVIGILIWVLVVAGIVGIAAAAGAGAAMMG